MNSDKLIDIYRKRDFGDLLQDSIRFVAWNAVPLLKAIAIFMGPLLLISAIISVNTVKDTFGGMNPFELIGNPDLAQEFFLNMAQQQGPSFGVQATSFVVSIALMIVQSIVFNSFIIRYGETQTGTLNIDTMKNDVFSNFVPFLGLILLQIVIYIVSAILLGIALAVVGLVFGSMGHVGGALVVIIGFGSIILYLAYVIVPLAFSYFIRLYEGPDNIAALRKSFKIVAAKRWSTFGLFFVLGIVLIIVAGIVGVLGINEIFKGNFVTGVVWSLASSIVAYLLYAMFYAAIAMQYFNVTGAGNDPNGGDLIDQIGLDGPSDEF